VPDKDQVPPAFLLAIGSVPPSSPHVPSLLLGLGWCHMCGGGVDGWHSCGDCHSGWRIVMVEMGRVTYAFRGICVGCTGACNISSIAIVSSISPLGARKVMIKFKSESCWDTFDATWGLTLHRLPVLLLPGKLPWLHLVEPQKCRD
jgi:hypothetical protein